MSRRLSRISLALVILMSSHVWALGLGDIRLQSALNEPLRAEIELLSATPDELDNLKIAMASADTFERYGLDRPVRSGRADGNVIEIRSATPMAEPFLTFLVEATWSRGRVLREYTVLLDPPTFAPPAAETAPAVQAPSRAMPADSGEIRRPAPTPQRATPQPAPTRQAAPAPERSQPEPQPVRDESPYDTTTGGDYTVARSETLWGITSRVRPDGRLTMNQTMLAIFEANPAAFGGNINVLKAGASLRIPSADEIIRIERGDALAEAQRQHAAWSGGATATTVADTTSRPSLTLVPPDDDYAGDTYGTDSDSTYDEPLTREDEIEQRIGELEAADVPQQQSLIEIRDNELAALRDELARIRGEVYEPPVDDTIVDDTGTADDAAPFVDADTTTDDVVADDVVADDVADDADAAAADASSDIIRQPTRSEPGLVEKAMAALTSIWAIIIGAVVVIVGGLLFWFMRRGRDDDDEPDTWRALDSDETDAAAGAATETLHVPVRDEESIMVVEQESGLRPLDDGTMEVPVPDFVEAPVVPIKAKDPTGSFDSLEDTFSSDTAINLDQSDPIAEADFHMAYGLYDQAADLVNGALENEPQNQDLLTKLCEVYFVWGNRDAFVGAAGRLKTAVGGGESADWDKVVIMGQQIAGEDELFAGASAAGATKVVDLSFDAESDDTGVLDMEFIDDSGSNDIVDLGSDVAELEPAEDAGMDFLLDDEATEVVVEEEVAVASPAAGAPDFDVTAEMPSVEETAEMPSPDSTVETPTIEQQLDVLSGTAELPSLEGTLDDIAESVGEASDQTAEINLDDLGLDVDGLAETELASFDDLDMTGENPAVSDTGINRALDELAEATGKNPEIDPNDTSVQQALKGDDTAFNEAFGDSTGLNAVLDEALLDATGVTQALSGDFAVETAADTGEHFSDDDSTLLAPDYGDDSTLPAPDYGDDTPGELADDAATLLASLDDDEDEGDFDFARTEALPKDAFTDIVNLDETGELPAVASTDVDLDLDDLTAALKISELAGDTVEQVRDDATIEQVRDDATVQQPRPGIVQEEDAETLALGPEDVSEDLHDARTMTEVGTKLDLARAYVDMGDPGGARSILEEVLDEGDEGQRQQAQQLLDSLPS
jgi:pilus assembly protein FimV